MNGRGLTISENGAASIDEKERAEVTSVNPSKNPSSVVPILAAPWLLKAGIEVMLAAINVKFSEVTRIMMAFLFLDQFGGSYSWLSS